MAGGSCCLSLQVEVSFSFFFLFFFPAVDCGDGWMWLVGLLFMVVSGDFFFFFFPCYDLWWWVDVASGGDGGFLLVVACVVGLWCFWYGRWVFGGWLGLCGGGMVVVGNV